MKSRPPHDGSGGAMLDTTALEALARRAAAAIDADALVRLTRDLVRIPSVYRPGSTTEAETAAYLADHLGMLGFEVAVHEAAPNRPNVVADWNSGRPGRSLILEGHTDVVTEGDPAAWSFSPFGAVVASGRIYGRGAADMKGGLAAAICALDAVCRTAPDLPGRVRLAALADEEGMMLGIKAFIRGGYAQGFDAALICEPEENQICLHQRGAMRVLATFRGKMAHGAMPYAGTNPIPWAARFVLGLAEAEAREQARHGAHTSLGLPHITPTTVRAPAAGEPQFNVMAGEAQVTVDVRTIPGQDHAEIRRSLEAIADHVRAQDPAAQIALDVIEDRPWTETPATDPIVGAVERAYRTILGAEPRYGGVPGATDGTFLRAWVGIPIVTIGPGGREIPHQADEYVEIAELVVAARLYAAAAVYFLGEGSP
ncbi:MAG: M20 family metallopeptidase [bacterium]|nr:M20 family metallopeptidase [bacterium]